MLINCKTNTNYFLTVPLTCLLFLDTSSTIHWTLRCIISLPKVHIWPYHSFAQKHSVCLYILLHSFLQWDKSPLLGIRFLWSGPSQTLQVSFSSSSCILKAKKELFTASLEFLISIPLLKFFPAGEAPYSLSLCSNLFQPSVTLKRHFSQTASPLSHIWK